MELPTFIMAYMKKAQHYFEMTRIMFIIAPGPLVSTHIQKMEAEENIHHQQ
jgi:hypothetical protein